ncbi:hypothetical protein CA233_19650 [Sphingomonas sp. ABOLD]|uniref:Uncharacterized protein n=1 Tax=Sphingomonas trueperi TaxID=53317 RepID=A0A7X6BDL7_9SPHN|nr:MULTISPECIES: hypothetical protein [Sphingomonas]NJB97862.1 hypothetical protein [Sphingomonas trueperi]RSV40563.1 hypothetical protein CA233_19650 [Sphingomonas sp. ABOLD]RSV41463.1 hypothetical protein CA234_09280 [Sphingomonas sp. ABOLE]
MDWSGPGFVIALVAISTFGWLANNWIRAKHGYSISDDHGKNIDKIDAHTNRKIDLLAAENERLAGQISRLEDRISVLERIATDPAERTARAIDALR